MVKAGPQFRVRYLINENVEERYFYTREANDQFASGLELMSVQQIKVQGCFAGSWLGY